MDYILLMYTVSCFSVILVHKLLQSKYEYTFYKYKYNNNYFYWHYYAIKKIAKIIPVIKKVRRKLKL